MSDIEVDNGVDKFCSSSQQFGRVLVNSHVAQPLARACHQWVGRDIPSAPD